MFAIDTSWHESITTRVSTRGFQPTAVSAPSVGKLESLAAAINDLGLGVRVAFAGSGIDRLFSGVVGSYGKIKGMTTVALFLGDESGADTPERIGYFGEALILEAERLGVATCWVSGTFDRAHAASMVALGKGEKVFAVTPLGYPAERKTFTESLMKSVVGSAKRKPIESIATGLHEDRPAWIDSALEAARLAPSAANLQPWRFAIQRESDAWHVTLGPSSSPTVRNRLDCGIAKLHFELGAGAAGMEGTWSKDPSGGERFTVTR